MIIRENKIAQIITWIGIIEMIVGFIVGFIFILDEEIGMVAIVWVTSFVSGMFIISFAEIIEQLHQLNLKQMKNPEDDDLELLND